MTLTWWCGLLPIEADAVRCPHYSAVFFDAYAYSTCESRGLVAREWALWEDVIREENDMTIQDGRREMTADQRAEQDRLYAEVNAAWQAIADVEEANPFIRVEKDNPLYQRLKAAEQRYNAAHAAMKAFWGAISAERTGQPYTPEPEGGDTCSCEDPDTCPQYECYECGEVFSEFDSGEEGNRCQSCGKFASRTDVEVCLLCGEEIGEAVAA